MSRPVMEPKVWRGTFAIRSAIVGAAETATRTATSTATADPGSGYLPVHPHECDHGGAEACRHDRRGRRPIATGEPHDQPHTGQRRRGGEERVRRAGRPARRDRRGRQSGGDERGPGGAVGDEASRADPRTDRDRDEQADRGRGEQDRNQQRALVSPAQPPQQHARHTERTADDHHRDRKRGLRGHADEMIGGVLRQRRRDVLDHRPVPFGRTGGHQREHIAVGDVVAGERDIRRQRRHPGGAGEFISRGRQFGGPATAQHLVDRDDRRIEQRR